ncbi:hypothetical protein Tco_0529343 [Tanacetum coccineum]
MVTGMRIRHSKANAFRGVSFDETRAEVINDLAVQLPLSYSSIIIEACRREDSPPPGFSTLTPLPGPNVGELPPITAFTFTTRSSDSTPLTNCASTSANTNLVITPAFIEANYEVLESLLRDRRRQVRNEDIRSELDYYSEEYDEEREMEPRGRVVEFEEAPNRDGNRVERESDGRRPSEQRVEEGGSRGGNLPPLLTTHLGRSENGKPL